MCRYFEMQDLQLLYRERISVRDLRRVVSSRSLPQPAKSLLPTEKNWTWAERTYSQHWRSHWKALGHGSKGTDARVFAGC